MALDAERLPGWIDGRWGDSGSWLGSNPDPYLIASPTTITRESIVSHWGMRFTDCWVMAWSLLDPYSVPEERKWM